MAFNDSVRVFMYVNPTTKKVEKMMCYTAFGMAERANSDWVPTTREESGIDGLAADVVYELDWDTDFLPMSVEDDNSEHAAVELYDSGNLTEEDAKKYGYVHIDPNDSGNPDLDKLIGQ